MSDPPKSESLEQTAKRLLDAGRELSKQDQFTPVQLPPISEPRFSRFHGRIKRMLDAIRRRPK